MIKLVLVSTCLLLSISNSYAQKSSVTNELREQEFRARYKSIEPSLSRDNFCKKDYDKVKNYLLQHLYKLDGNLPAISDSKRKRLGFVINEWKNENRDKQYRSNLWLTEMYPDADYWQITLENEVKPLIKLLEAINWERDRDELTNYLNLLRGKRYYSTREQENAPNLISHYIVLTKKVDETLRQVIDTDTQLRRLSQSNRLDKALGSDPLARTLLTMEFSLRYRDEMRYLVDCQLRFLGEF